MSKEDFITIKGTVTDSLPGSKFEVLLENHHKVICSLSGKLRMNHIMVLNGDTVDVEISPYDLTKGRISWRYK